MSSSGAVDGTSVSHYLHPDFLEPLPSSLDPKQNPLVLLAQTCNNIGKDVSFANSKKSSSLKSSETRLSTPPKLISLKTDEDKQPSSTSTEQRHSPTSTRSPKYAVTPEQVKPENKALSPALKAAPASDEKLGTRCAMQRTTPVGGSPREKSSPCKSPSSHEPSAQPGSFPFPLPHPALLSAAYSAAVPWPTLPFPHIAAAAAASLPGLACPCGQCGLGSPGAATAQGAPCGSAGTGHCSCPHCLTHPPSSQPHSVVHDSFSSACFYSGLLNSYLGQHVGGTSPGPGAKTVVSPGVSSSTSNPSTTSSTATSRTVEYCMYCGKHCPSPEQLLAHLQCHMTTTDSVSPPAPAPGPSPGLSLYSSSAAADLIRKLYTSSAVAAVAGSNSSPGAAATAGLSPRFHPYRSFLPKLSPHRAPFQPFGAPIV